MMSHEAILSAGDSNVHRFLVFTAFFLGSYLILMKSRTWDVSGPKRQIVLASASIGSILGAMIPGYFAGELVGSSTKADVFENYLYGPKTVIGGLLLGFVLVALSKKIFKIKAETSDEFVTGTCVLMLIGRVGCFFQHCCYGIVVPSGWGMDFGDGKSRLPVQLVEAGFVLGLLVFFWNLETKKKLFDQRFFLFFLLYGVGRAVLEFLREPIAARALGLGFYQWLSLLLAGIGLYQLCKRTLLNRNRLIGEF